MDEPLFRQLMDHLFPGDHKAHGAAIAVGVAETERGARLLARDLLLARDGVDYVPGTRGHHALTAPFIAKATNYCERERLGYLAVHCHGGRDRVDFSPTDFETHERSYQSMLDVTTGGPVGWLVFAEDAVAGDIWLFKGRYPLDHLRVVGARMRMVAPAPTAGPRRSHARYDRQVRMFGDVGQTILASLKVGIIGLGGGGSLINEWLARLGVGHIVAVDFDRIERTNLSRIVGATRQDAGLKREKVQVAARVARQANPKIQFDAVAGSVLDEPTARLLQDVDFLFLASDSIQSRLVFNALVQQYLIPGVQIGAKVPVDRKTGDVGDIFTATRPVLPGPGRGCLECHDLIPPALLQEEALREEERRAQQYVNDEDVVAPSVITLNVLSAARAVNDFMMIFTGLHSDDVDLRHEMHFVRERQLQRVRPRQKPHCLDCSSISGSRRARGDRARLPCRMPPV